jgi:hypothetical protein
MFQDILKESRVYQEIGQEFLEQGFEKGFEQGLELAREQERQALLWSLGMLPKPFFHQPQRNKCTPPICIIKRVMPT